MAPPLADAASACVGDGVVSNPECERQAPYQGRGLGGSRLAWHPEMHRRWLREDTTH